MSLIQFHLILRSIGWFFVGFILSSVNDYIWLGVIDIYQALVQSDISVEIKFGNTYLTKSWTFKCLALSYCSIYIQSTEMHIKHAWNDCWEPESISLELHNNT